MAAVANDVPTNAFGFISEPEFGPWEAWFGLGSQFIIVVAILALTLTYFSRRNRLTQPVRRNFLKLRLRQVKYLSALAFLISAVVSGLLVYRVLMRGAIAGVDFDSVMGPLAENLTGLIIGTMVATFGVLCMLLMLWRGRDLTPPDDKVG